MNTVSSSDPTCHDDECITMAFFWGRQKQDMLLRAVHIQRRCVMTPRRQFLDQSSSTTKGEDETSMASEFAALVQVVEAYIYTVSLVFSRHVCSVIVLW